MPTSLSRSMSVIKHLTSKYGKYSSQHEYLAKANGHWAAVPSSTGTLNLTAVGRISLLKQHGGVDVLQMYPAHKADPSTSAGWTYDTFLRVAEACQQAGYPFGLGLGPTGNSTNNVGCMFNAFGAYLVNDKGEVTANSPEVHAALDYGRKLTKALPPETVSYDDASNNRALISGRSALIMNPPSAWAVAKRDAPDVAKDTWHFPMPAGPKGRLIPYNYCFYGAWKFGRNKSAAKELITYLQERNQVGEREVASDGYDLPPLISMNDFDIWSQVEPPKGTVYNYPIRPWHNSQESLTGYPAPPAIGARIWARAIHPTMWAKVMTGQSNEEVIAWATNELQGFMR